jgi:hypothetical protein
MTRDGDEIIDATDLFRTDLDDVADQLGGIVSLPTMTSGRLRNLFDAAAGPAQAHELLAEASVRQAFEEAPSD